MYNFLPFWPLSLTNYQPLSGPVRNYKQLPVCPHGALKNKILDFHTNRITPSPFSLFKNKKRSYPFLRFPSPLHAFWEVSGMKMLCANLKLNSSSNWKVVSVRYSASDSLCMWYWVSRSPSPGTWVNPDCLQRRAPHSSASFSSYSQDIHIGFFLGFFRNWYKFWYGLIKNYGIIWEFFPNVRLYFYILAISS